jgi:hypothetical protein
MGTITVVNQTDSTIYVAVAIINTTKVSVGGWFYTIEPNQKEEWERDYSAVISVARSKKVGEVVETYLGVVDETFVVS